MERSELISYALDVAAYLILKVKEIDRIILYGSVVRGDFNNNSDIDIFVDSKNKDINSNVEKALNDYYKTLKFKAWKLKGFENELSVISSRLDNNEWKELKRAMLTEGIVLYGKFAGSPDNLVQYTIFSFENVKPDTKRVAVFRALFGFKNGRKEYPGLIKKLEGFRLGKGSVIVPVSKANELKNYFHRQKLQVRIFDIWSDESF